MAKYALMVNRKRFENDVISERYVLVNATGEKIFENEKPSEYTVLRKKALTNLRQGQKESIMRDMGLKKVRGALGGVYWE